MTISFYNSRGEVTGVLSGDASVITATKELSESPWVEGDWFGKPYYVLNGEAIPKSINPVELSGFELINVPVPAEIWINSVKYDSDDEMVELDFDQPGIYKVKIIAWPYLDKEFLIENPA